MYWVSPRFFETVVLVSRHLFLRPRDANWRFCVASCCWTFLHFSLKSARSLSILWYGMRRRTKQEVSKMVTLGQTNIDVENQWTSAILRGTSSISGPFSTFILAYRRILIIFLQWSWNRMVQTWSGQGWTFRELCSESSTGPLWYLGMNTLGTMNFNDRVRMLARGRSW